MGKKDNKNLIIILIVIVGILLLSQLFGIGFRSYNMMGGYNVFWILAFIAAAWVIYDVIVNNTKLSDGMKVLWVLLAIFFSIITAIIYYIVGRNAKNDLFAGKERIFK